MTLENIQQFGEEIQKFKTEPAKAYVLKEELYYNFLIHVTENNDFNLGEMAYKILQITDVNWMKGE